MSSKPRSHSSAEVSSALEHKSDKKISIQVIDTTKESESDKVQDLSDFLSNLDTTNNINEDDSTPEKGRKRNSTIIGTNVADELKALRTSEKEVNQEITNSLSETPSKRPSGRRRKNGQNTLRNLTKSPSLLQIESVWNANEITNGIFIGDVDSSSNLSELKTHNITHIICLLGDHPPSFPSDFKYLVIDALDSGDFDIMSHFPNTNEFINDAVRGKSHILVHCHKGVSRSATVVLAYLMSEHKYTFDQAVDLVSSKRPVACPNLGFIKQLKLYEQIQYKLTGNSEGHEIYRRFKLKNQLRVVKSGLGDIISEEAQFVYLCKVCKCVLLNSNSAIEHDPGVQDDFTLLNSKPTERKERECNLIFSLPHQWMGTDIFSEDSGRFRCPSCSTLLGKWNLAGESCMCGVSIKPAFLVFSALVSREQSINLTDTIKERSQTNSRKSLPWKWSVNNIRKTKTTEDFSQSEKSPGRRSGFISPLSPKKSTTLTSETKQRMRNTHGTLRNYRGSKDIVEDIVEVEKPPSPQQIAEIEVPGTTQSEPTTPVKAKRNKKFINFKLPAIVSKKKKEEKEEEITSVPKERKFFDLFKKDKSKRESQL